MYFDMHVHDRGGKEAYKETEAHALEVAEKAGVDGILVMPNTNPPITTRKLAEEKLERADKSGSKVFYGIHFGITSNPNQLREFVMAHRELFPRIAGGKLYMGRSVGDLAVVDESEQRKVFLFLSGLGYKGVITIHGEKESLLKPELWNPQNPISHCWARPKEAELASYQDAVRFAVDAEFRGKLHFTHVSFPEAVRYIDAVKRNLAKTEFGGFQISCDVTPHHLFACDEMMHHPDGITFKVNPPLRSLDDMNGLRECVRQGLIDCIATDHALHTLNEKTGIAKDRKGEPIYLSGLPGVEKWSKIYQKLKEMGLSSQEVEDLTFNNAVKIFGLEKYVKRTDNAGDLNLREYSYGNYL